MRALIATILIIALVAVGPCGIGCQRDAGPAGHPSIIGQLRIVPPGLRAPLMAMSAPGSSRVRLTQGLLCRMAIPGPASPDLSLRARPGRLQGFGHRYGFGALFVPSTAWRARSTFHPGPCALPHRAVVLVERHRVLWSGPQSRKGPDRPACSSARRSWPPWIWHRPRLAPFLSVAAIGPSRRCCKAYPSPPITA